MAARILNGTDIGRQIQEELRQQVEEMKRAGITPGLAAVLVGDNPASEVYVRNKISACEDLGLYSEKITPPAGISTRALLAEIRELNRRPEIDAILVQLPLPPQVDAQEILLAIDPAKDVDGFHPMNVGALVSQRPGLRPCTPAGVMELLRRSGIEIKGRRAVVIGRSDIVGKPLALLLLHAHATVTICHSQTRELAAVARSADILAAAIGRPAFVTSEFVQPGATVIDIGINRVEDPETAERLFARHPERLEAFRRKGSALVGDVHPDVVEVAGALTPVPGGVGPLTISMLMVNTVEAARRRRGQSVVADDSALSGAGQFEAAR
ncbi:MAG TPA: bifunctional methylenetetrahydrofolate dehydrogenase/methenyltetrahydrofolate cyclohydrolase FolD [Candidatus Acidoferrales bacterium]|nr:bifunctional methylenetetrahydrofolate dehydrogenase/methenyltetrahydrofolate cyclohydrolase FolD [Candidatus Acidoferrales bacterium]